MLQALDLRRVVPVAAAQGLTGVKHLLGIGGVGQVDAQFLGTLQGEVEVLLVQVDTEARLEGAFDYALGVHFEDLRRREAAHQGFTHLGWVDPASIS